VERGDVELAQLYVARFHKLSHVLAALDDMVHSSTIMHLSFWRPLARSSWAAQHPQLISRLMCNPASHDWGMVGSKVGMGTGGASPAKAESRIGFRAASEMLVRKLRMCLLDEPALSVALALEPLQQWAAALRPVALHFRPVVAAFSQAMREEAFIRKLAKAEAAKPASRAVFQEIVAAEVPVRLTGELLWALLDEELTPQRHCDAHLLPALRELALSIDESLELMGGASASELTRLVRVHALLKPPCLAPAPRALALALRGSNGLTSGADPTSVEGEEESGDPGHATIIVAEKVQHTGAADLGDYLQCGALYSCQESGGGGSGPVRAGAASAMSGGGCDSEGLLWVPAHRREEGEFEVELLPPNVMIMLRSTAAFDPPRKGRRGAGVGGSEDGTRRGRRGGGQNRGAGGPAQSTITHQDRHRLMLYNDSLVLVSVNDADDADALVDVAHGVAEVHSGQGLGGNTSPWPVAEGVAKDNTERVAAPSDGPARSGAAAAGAVLCGVGKWLRQDRSAQPQVLSLAHRWWLSEMQLSDVRESVSSNVVAAASLEHSVALQHMVASVDLQKSVLFDDSFLYSDRVQEDRKMQPRGQPVWVKFLNAADKRVFIDAVARLKEAALVEENGE